MVLVQEDSSHIEHVIYYVSRLLVGPKLRYSNIEKLAFAVVHAMKKLFHYINLRKIVVVANVNNFQHVLTHRMIGRKYLKWIVILQEFDLKFALVKSKKSLAFVELVLELPKEDEKDSGEETLPDEHIFLISSTDPWYGDLIVYLQTLRCPSHAYRED